MLLPDKPAKYAKMLFTADTKCALLNFMPKKEFVIHSHRSDLRIQSCQMAYFQTKNTHLGKFWKVLHFVAIWSILWPLGISYGYLVFFPVLVCSTKENLATLMYIQIWFDWYFKDLEKQWPGPKTLDRFARLFGTTYQNGGKLYEMTTRNT
jgi:hypothetical protein